MRLEVEVCRQHTGTHQFLLQDLHEVQQTLWLTATYIIHSVGWHRQAVLTFLAFRSPLHHTDHSLHDVVDIGEVPATVSVVEDLDGLALQQFVRKAEVRHIRSAGRTVHGEEAQSRRGDVIQFRVAVRKQFIALLRCRIQAHRVIHPVIR